VNRVELAWVAGGAALLLLGWYAMAHYAMGYEDGKATGLVRLTTVDGKEVEAAAGAAFLRLRAAAHAAGHALVLNSGFRRMEKQQELYDLYQRGLGNTAARPGTSNHQRGRVDRARRRGPAVDIGGVGSFSSAAYRWLEQNAARFGFDGTEGRAVNEFWHWVYLGEAA
jgi:LAS superfamily LD-carboxypeptidase LdcB